jgi:hypothetical protein
MRRALSLHVRLFAAATAALLVLGGCGGGGGGASDNPENGDAAATGGTTGGTPDAASGGDTGGDPGGTPPPPDAAANDAAPPDAALPDASPPPDADGDGVPDADDNCPQAPQPRSSATRTSTHWATPAMSATRIATGRPDRDDLCPAFAGPTPDSDADGFGDACDLCPAVADPAQADGDGDGLGDACEIPNDDDADGVPDARDNCPRRNNEDQADATWTAWETLVTIAPGRLIRPRATSIGTVSGTRCDVCPDTALVAENHIDRDGDGQPSARATVTTPVADRSTALLETCDGRRQRLRPPGRRRLRRTSGRPAAPVWVSADATGSCAATPDGRTTCDATPRSAPSRESAISS